MWVRRRLVRLRGDLSCVQIIVAIPSHFACWTTLDHSHEVDGHFMPPLCILMRSNAPSSHLFADFLSCPRPTYIHTYITFSETYIHSSIRPSIHPSIHPVSCHPPSIHLASHPSYHPSLHLFSRLCIHLSPLLCMHVVMHPSNYAFKHAS